MTLLRIVIVLSFFVFAGFLPKTTSRLSASC